MIRPVAAEPGSVWIVVQEDRVDNQILGVFATMDEAHAFLESLAADSPEDTYSYGRYPIGWHR